ncbi:hypothetical protein GCM10010433_04980 [Streptomyces pulveraceus]
MTAAMVENDQTSEGRPWDCLLRTWRELDVPEGWRAEIDEGQIVLVPPPHAHHNGIAAKVQRRLYRDLPEELEIYQTLGIHVAALDKLYVPGLVVMPSELIDAADPEINDPMDAAEALLVVEVASKGNARDDRTKEYRAYARADVSAHRPVRHAWGDGHPVHGAQRGRDVQALRSGAVREAAGPAGAVRHDAPHG